MQITNETVQSAINVVFGVLTVAAAMVRLFGRQDTGWGRVILKIGNDFLPHKPPADPGSDAAPPKPPTANPGQPSSSLIVGLVVASLFVVGCGATLKDAIAVAVNAGEQSEAGLSIIRGVVDSYFLQRPNPVLQTAIVELIGDVSEADEALIRLGEGHDRVAAGDIAVAVSKLAKAYEDLMQTLHTVGIVVPGKAAGTGEPVYLFAVGPKVGKPVPQLPELARGRS